MATWALMPGAARSVVSVQQATESAPAAAGDGLSLVGVDACVIWLRVVGGVFSGGGWLRGYSLHPANGWKRSPGADRPVPDEAIGLDQIVVETFSIASRRGRFALLADGVTHTGSELQMEIVCTSRTGVPL